MQQVCLARRTPARPPPLSNPCSPGWTEHYDSGLFTGSDPGGWDWFGNDGNTIWTRPTPPQGFTDMLAENQTPAGQNGNG